MARQSLRLNCGRIWTQTQLYAQTDKLDHLDTQTASLFSDKMQHYVAENSEGYRAVGGFSCLLSESLRANYGRSNVHAHTLPASHQVSFFKKNKQ